MEGGGFCCDFFSLLMKNKDGCLLVIYGIETNFSFIRMNIYIFFYSCCTIGNLGWMGGTAENTEVLLSIGEGFFSLFVECDI